MASNKGVEFMQQLLDAEKLSEIVISDAKKNRLARLRSAKDKAEEEVKKYKDEQEEKHQRESGKKATADPTAELKNATQAGINSVHLDYRKHGEATVEYITAKVLDVPTTLTDTQKQSLRTDMVPIPACRAEFSGYHSHVEVAATSRGLGDEPMMSTSRGLGDEPMMSTSRGLGDEPMMSTSRGLGDEPMMSVKLPSKSEERLLSSEFGFFLKAYVIPVFLFCMVPLVMDK